MREQYSLVSAEEEDESGEEVIEEIYEKRVNTTPADEAYELEYELSFGSKYVRVTIDKETAKALTVLSTKDGATRELKETTLLYTAVHRVLEDAAQELGKPVKYIFKTDYRSLISWAETSGREIFNWEDEFDVTMSDSGVDEAINKTGKWFVATINPLAISFDQEYLGKEY